MAFRMNRPTIKGTPLHKASIAKAKAKAKSQSIVSQRKTQADTGLLGASESLALSNVSKAQDYKLKSYDLNNISKKKKKTKKNKDNNTDELEIEKNRVNNLETEDIEYNDEDIQADLDRITEEENKNSTTTTSKNKPFENWKEKEEKENIRLAEETLASENAASAKRMKKAAKVVRPKKEWGKKIGNFFRNSAGQLRDAAGNLIEGTLNAAGEILNTAGNIVGDVLEGVDTGVENVSSDINKGIEGIEKVIQAETSRIKAAYDEKIRLMKEKELSEQQEKERMARWEEEMKRDIATMNQQVKNKKGGISEDQKLKSVEYSSEGKSPMEMRDDRIYQFAKKDGPLRKNMIKSGYIPQN